LRDLVETALAPYRSDGDRCEVHGDPVALRAKMAVPLGLVLHELVTNAVKYGAWAQPGGALRVTWRRDGARDGGRVQLVWREQTPAPIARPQREGFGSMLMTSSARQLEGSIERSFHDDGVEVLMEFAAG